MTQKEALEIMKSGHNVFLTGRPGSGKTYLLNKFIQFLRQKNIPTGVTASTGIAATYLNGMTIHSWCGMGVLSQLDDEKLKKILRKKNLQTRLRKSRVLIIDEVSMLSARHLDVASEIVRSFRQSWEPFGGMQVVLCGDFFQLPPVGNKNDRKTCLFAYHSSAWPGLKFKICYLAEQHRQTDREYLFALEAIRTNSVDETVRALLQRRIGASLRTGPHTKFGVGAGQSRSFRVRPEYTKLYTHNVDVDAINARELQKLPGKERVFHRSSSGPMALVEMLHRSCLAPEALALKKGAFVMFVRNNLEQGFVNGTLGIVEKFDDDGFPVVETKTGRRIKVFPEKWRIEEDDEVKAEIRQLPLRLAWAITVHKSQGMTIDACEIDLRKSFEPGMGYVALSRTSSLEGIRLVGFNDIALRVNEEALKMDKRFQESSRRIAAEFLLLGRKN
ncbi:AAA family ATPase [Patescibacteria group bacterium]|nr:AAA family ATPase [Patescibacteria group bacterium]